MALLIDPTDPMLCVLCSKVVTDKHLYRLDPKTYKPHKGPMPLSAIKGFSISSGEDQAVLIHLHDDNDIVLTLRGQACAAELVSLVAQTVGTMCVVRPCCGCGCGCGAADRHPSFF